jgi:hypothetical protein
MLSGIVMWYFDRVACSAVVDHFGESLPVLWDECRQKGFWRLCGCRLSILFAEVVDKEFFYDHVFSFLCDL